MSNRIATALIPLLLSASLAACSGGSDDPRAVTPDEAAQLNDAAAMLDANSIDLDAVSDDAANDTQPAADPRDANQMDAS